MASCPSIDGAYGPQSTDRQIEAAPTTSKCCERRDGGYGCRNCVTFPIPGGSGASSEACIGDCSTINALFPGERWEPTGYTGCSNTNLQCGDTGITYGAGTCSAVCTRRVPTMTEATTLSCCGFNGGVLPTNPIGTCAPGFCPNGPQCAAYVETYCENNIDPTTGLWPAACDQYLTNTSNGAASSLVISGLAQKYLTVAYTGTPGSNPFAENYAAKYCSLYPGACSSVLSAGYCSTVSRADLATESGEVIDANLLNLCSCFMAITPANYPFLSESTSVSCDPLCNISSVKPGQFNGGTFQPVQCPNAVCIISKAAIDIVNSSGGSVSFDQICGSCAPSQTPSGGSTQSCSTCYISGLTISEINSQITGGTRVSQVCGQCIDPSTNLPISCMGGGGACTTSADCPVGESCGPNGVCFENPSPPGPSSGFIAKLVAWIQDHELVAVGSTSALLLMVVIILFYLGFRNRK